MTIDSHLSEDAICQKSRQKGLQLTPISHYYQHHTPQSTNAFIVNYANITAPQIEQIIQMLTEILLSES